MTAPFLCEMCSTASNMYRLGWDERNGGNISMLVDADEAAEYLDLNNVLRRILTGFDAKALAGKLLIVTGTGKYFKNIEKQPEKDLGVIRISADGTEAELLWGFTDGGSFTSELPSHLMTHMSRLAADPLHRVVTHCHPTYTVAMTRVHPLDERAFTRTLWKTCTECIIVFPEGVGVLPWMVCGTNEIGAATAEKMKDRRLVAWASHGIYATGRDLDEAFGLIETVEKAAQLYMLTAHLPTLNTITDENLKALAARFNVDYRKDYLDE